MRAFFWVIFIFVILCSSCWNKNKNTVSGTDKMVDNNIAFSDIRAVAYGDKKWVKVGTDRSYDGRIGYAGDN